MYEYLTNPIFPIVLFFVSVCASAALAFLPNSRRFAGGIFWASAILGLVFLAWWLHSVQGSLSFVHMSVLLSAFAVILTGWVCSFLYSLRRQLDTLSGKIENYIEPRKLTEEQREALIEYLLPRPKGTVAVCCLVGDEEAKAYGVQLRAALIDGGWKASWYEKAEHTPRGLQITDGLRTHEWKAQGQGPQNLLASALSKANIRTSGGGSSPSNEEACEYELIVGRRHLRLDKMDGV